MIGVWEPCPTRIESEANMATENEGKPNGADPQILRGFQELNERMEGLKTQLEKSLTDACQSHERSLAETPKQRLSRS